MKKTKKQSSSRKPIGKRLSDVVGVFTESIEKSFKNVAGRISEIFGMLLSLIIPKSLLKKVDEAGKSKQVKKLGKQVGELTEQVEKKFTKGATGVLEVLQNLFAILVPEFVRVRIAKISNAIWKKIAEFSKQFARGVDRLAEKYLPQWLLRAIKQTWKRILRWYKSLNKFFLAWGKSRDYKKLAWSTPAILMLIPLIVCAGISPLYSNLEKIQHYNVAHGKALGDEDFDVAALYQRKLSQLGYLQMERREYTAALSLAKAEQYDQAYEMMSKIAPEAEPGYMYGHLWIASALRSGRIPNVSEDKSWGLIEIHAKHVQSQDPRNKYAEYLLIKVAQRAGISPIPAMKRLAEDYPEFYGELWVHYVEAGEIGNARIAAKRFSSYVEQKKATNEEGLSLSDYTLWAGAQQMLGDTVKAQEITFEGSLKYENAPELKKMAAIVLLAELKNIDQTSDEAIELLKQAHVADPENEYVIRSLGSRLANDNTLKMRRVINELKDEGRLSADILLAAGDVHARAMRFDEAQKFYLEACEVDKKSGVGYNNIAWIYANAMQPANLEAALGAVNEALEIEVDATFLETRGQIHFKRGRDYWRAAAEDLELALNGKLPEVDRVNAHQTLAEIYDWLGEPERADAHREQTDATLAESRLAQQP